MFYATYNNYFILYKPYGESVLYILHDAEKRMKYIFNLYVFKIELLIRVADVLNNIFFYAERQKYIFNLFAFKVELL